MEAGKLTLTVEEDESGDLVLTFPPEMLVQMDWQPGDTLIWIDKGDGSWELKKQSLPSQPLAPEEC